MAEFLGFNPNVMRLNQKTVVPAAIAAPIETPIAEKTPFQQFLDNAVSSLNGISGEEMSTDQLIKNYIAGKSSIEEVIMATNKLSLSIQLAVTVINTAVQTFKEIQQMPV